MIKKIFYEKILNFRMVEIKEFNKYGIGKYHMIETEDDIPDWTLAGLGASVTKLDSETEPCSMRDLLSDFMPIVITGNLPPRTIPTRAAAAERFEDVLFKNSELGLYLTAGDCQIKPPLKPSSTFKQIINNIKSNTIELETSIPQKRCFIRLNSCLILHNH